MSTRSFPIPAIPGVGQLPLGGMLTGDVHLTGDSAAPASKVCARLAGFTIRETLFGDGSVKFTPGADASAVEGKFFGDKVTVDGYVTFVPQLAFNGTIKFTDLELEKILPEMRNLAELRGVASGEVRVSWSLSSGLFAALKLPTVQIVMTSDEDGRKRQSVLKNDGDVLLSTDGASLRVDRLKLVSPIPTTFSMTGTIARHDADVRLQGQTKLELLEYFFQSAFDHTHGNASLDLAIKGDLDRPDLLGSITLEKARLEPRGMESFVDVPSGRVDFTPNRVSLTNLSATVDGATTSASGWVELHRWHPGAISATVTGEASPAILKWFVPQVVEASGRLAIDVQVGGRYSRPDWSGTVVIKGVKGRLRDFPQEIGISQGTARFDRADYEIDFEGIKATLEDQPLEVAGKVQFQEQGDPLRNLEINIRGIELGYTNDQFALKVSPDVRLSGNGQQLKLKGAMLISEGRYFAPTIDPKALVVKARVVERTPPVWQGSPLLETMELDLDVQSTGSLAVKNETFNLVGSAALQVSGTLSDPHLRRTACIEPDGELHLPAMRTPFQSERSYVIFDAGRRMLDETPTLDLDLQRPLLDNNDLSPHPEPEDGRHHPEARHQAVGAAGRLGSERHPARHLHGQDADSVAADANPSGGGGASGSASDTIAKTVTGDGVGDIISDPLRKVFGFDQTSFEFSTGSVDLRFCKRFTRVVKTCGYGELGFAGSSRVEQRLAAPLLRLVLRGGARRVPEPERRDRSRNRSRAASSSSSCRSPSATDMLRADAECDRSPASR